MIEFAGIEVGTGSSMTCARCTPPDSHSMRPLDAIVAELSQTALSGTRGPGPNVLLCGSEPFDHPHLPAVIAAAAACGFARIGLRTTAGALTVPANAAGVVAAGVRFVEVVLLGDEAAHDRLVGRPGAHADAVAGCKAFLSAATAASKDAVVACRIPACRHNLSALSGAMAGAAAAGAVAVHIDASALTKDDVDDVMAALETAAMSRMAACVTGATFTVPEPFGETPWRVLPHGDGRQASHEGDGS